MTIEQILNAYLSMLWGYFQYDLSVFSQGWIYYLFLIPAMFYFIFFVMKWAILTLPIWLPFRLMFCRSKNNEKA